MSGLGSGEAQDDVVEGCGAKCGRGRAPGLAGSRWALGSRRTLARMRRRDAALRAGAGGRKGGRGEVDVGVGVGVGWRGDVQRCESLSTSFRVQGVCAPCLATAPATVGGRLEARAWGRQLQRSSSGSAGTREGGSGQRAAAWGQR